MAYKATKFELVEVPLPGINPGGQTGTRWNFPDLPKLRYTSLQSIEIYTANDITATPTQQTPVTLAILQTAYLVLYANERQDLYRIPLINLHRIQNASNDPFVRQMFEFNNQKVTWDKSYIELGAAPGNTTNLSFAFGVYYV
jgi:hypothetical protein